MIYVVNQEYSLSWIQWLIKIGFSGGQRSYRMRLVSVGRIWNFIRIELNTLEISNTNIKWLQFRLEYWMVSKCLAGTWRHPMGTMPSRSLQQRANTRRSFCLLSDLTMKAAQLLLTYLMYIYTRLQNKIIYIPVKNKISKTNSRETQHDLPCRRWLRVERWLL